MSKEFSRRTFITGAFLVGPTIESAHVAREIDRINKQADQAEDNAEESPSVPDNYSQVVKEKLYEERHIPERTILGAGGMLLSSGFLLSERWLKNRKNTQHREAIQRNPFPSSSPSKP